MKKERKDLRTMALIAGSGAAGVLATLFMLVAIRGSAAAPETPAAPQVDASQQAVEEVSERVPMIGIRGSASLGERPPPIVYVDGVRVDRGMDGLPKLVSPDQIDRIEVLKGDAAKELYGSDAANGVIQIVTKSKEGS